MAGSASQNIDTLYYLKEVQNLDKHGHEGKGVPLQGLLLASAQRQKKVGCLEKNNFTE